MSELARSVNSLSHPAPPQTFGRYVLHAPIAHGGMAVIYTARLVGAEGFSRLVAAKRLHPQFTENPEFVAMFHDEAQIASRIHHPNVVPVLDVVVAGEEVILVQEYVHGVPLDKLFRAALLSKDPIPVGVVVAIVAGILAGLHAAHETKDEQEEPLNIVHRDVSPQNVIVSMDGIPRLLDFGIAKARSSVHVTREGLLKGKLAYMAPEQIRAEAVTRAADVYACGVLLWELLVHRRLHAGRSEMEILSAVLGGAIPTLTQALGDARACIADERWEQLTLLEPIVAQALTTAPAERFASAASMLDALLRARPAATPIEVSQWVKTLGADYLERRQQVLASNEESWRSHSKITTAAAAWESLPPESGVKLVARQEVTGVKEATRPIVPIEASSPSITISVVEVADDRHAASRAHLLPWLLAASLLLLSGTLLGILWLRRSPKDAVAPRSPEPLAVLATPAVAPPPSPRAALSPVTIAPAPPAKPSHAPPAPAPHAAHWSPPSKAPASPPTRAASNVPVAAAPNTPAPTGATTLATAPLPKAECNPPFYFEGAKKLYKPDCI